MQRWPDWLMAIGLTWMVGLTAFNIFYTYYGWFPIANGHYEEGVGLKKEIVNELFVTFGTNASSYVRQQMYPLIIITVAAFGYSIHNSRLRKANQSH